MNIFFTGQIQIGKSTVLNKVLEMIKNSANPQFGGFQTYHVPDCRDVFITEYGTEKKSDDNHKIATWKHNCMEPHNDVFNTFGVKILTKAEKKDIIVMDELGFLEKNSEPFKEKVFQCLNSPTPCIGILRKANIPWHAPIYADSETRIVEVTMANRQGLPYEICDLLLKQFRL